jgi:hypothetical protein
MQYLEFGTRIGTPANRVVTWDGLRFGSFLHIPFHVVRYHLGLARDFFSCDFLLLHTFIHDQP